MSELPTSPVVGPLRVVAVAPVGDLPRGPSLPYVLSLVAAGFPSPADDYIGEVLDLHELTGAHAARAAEKLRREGLEAQAVGAFVTTKGLGEGPHRSGSQAVALRPATNRTSDLVRAALLCLARCHEATDRRGRPYRYRKAGVTVWDVVPESPEQGHLFQAPDPQQAKLYEAIDRLNRRFGKRTVFMGSMGVPSPAAADATESGQAWAMKREQMSPRYTTRWDELVVAFAR